jgi:FkbM family methyltransferase
VGQPLGFRSGTYDERIFREVHEGNEYRLPERLEPDDVIVDIGMHIGGFCMAALERGSHHVYGFEAEASNFECAARNLQPYGDRVRIYNQAVWRSDRSAPSLKFTGSSDHPNTGGGGLIFWEGAGGFEQEVRAVAFDDVIRAVTDRGKQRVKLLKIDCEGSEFPILLTARTLPLIDTIAGEFHEVGGEFDTHLIPRRAQIRGVPRFTMPVLSEALQRAGFRVTSIRHAQTHLGLFFAVNEGRPTTARWSLAALGRRLGLFGW